MNFEKFTNILTLIVTLVLIFAFSAKAFAATQITNNYDQLYDMESASGSESAFSPSAAYAEGEEEGCGSGAKRIFSLIKSPTECIKQDLSTFGPDAAVAIVTELAIKSSIGGDKNDEDLLNGETLPYTTAMIDSMADVDYTHKGPRRMKIDNGMVGITALSMRTISEEAPMPVDLALFIQDVDNNLIFGSQEVYADPGDSAVPQFSSVVFPIWKWSRNVAIILLGLAVSIGGVMVMFRKKISPQVTASLYNILPSIPIGLLFIILSYPLAAIAVRFMHVLLGFCWELGKEIYGDVVTGPSFDNLGDFFIQTVNAIITFAFNTVTGVSFIWAILGIAMIVIVIFTGVAFLFGFVKVYLNFIILTISAPFVGLLSILPGKGGLLSNHLKKILVEMLVLPIMILLTMIGLAVAASSYDMDWGSFRVGFQSGVFLMGTLKVAIGVGIMWGAHKSRKTIQQALNVDSSIFGTAPQQRR